MDGWDQNAPEATSKDCKGAAISIEGYKKGDLDGKNWGDLEKEFGKPTGLDKLIRYIKRACSSNENNGSDALSLTSGKGLCEAEYLAVLSDINETVKSLRKNGQDEAADALEKVGLEAGNALLDAITAGASFIPYVGGAIDIFEAYTGRSITPPHERLTDTQRGISVVASIASVLPYVGKAVKILAEAIQGLKSSKKLDKAVDVAGSIVDSAKKKFGSGDGLNNFMDIVKTDVKSAGQNLSETISKMEYPKLWTDIKKKTGVQNAYRHYKDHGKEFPGLNNAVEYVEKAHTFVTKPPNGVFRKVRPNGDELFYHQATNTFAVRNAQGAPRTMFKPKDGIEYWNRQ